MGMRVSQSLLLVPYTLFTESMNTLPLLSFPMSSYHTSLANHCGFKACHLDKPSSSAASSINSTCELIPVFVRLGGSIGASSSATREFCTALLVGGNGGGVAIPEPLAGDPVIRRGGGCKMLLAGVEEPLLVRLGAGGGGAVVAETGGGWELLCARKVFGLGAGLGGAGLRRVCFIRCVGGSDNREDPFGGTESFWPGTLGFKLRRRD
jgi:hypothetical protein